MSCSGHGGADQIYAGAGNDVSYGGTGNDYISTMPETTRFTAKTAMTSSMGTPGTIFFMAE
jgi:Ca2+-binding RTX toxin-like protein